VFVIFRKHLFSKATSFLSIVIVDFQLLQPYVSTEITHALNSLIFVWLRSVFDLQMFDSLLKTLAARAILVIISAFVFTHGKNERNT
jgi:hypothetical protein